MSEISPLNSAISVATTGIVADAASLLADRDVLYSGAAQATGLPDPKELRGLPDEDAIRACLRRCALDWKLGGEDAPVGTFRDRPDSGSTSLRIHAESPLWIYARDHSPDSAAVAYEQHLVSVMAGQGIAEHANPSAGTQEDKRRLSAAVSLLQEIIPEIARSVLPFVHQVVLLASPITSLYLTQVPESIFISTRLVAGDSLGLADAVLHESLHEKMAVLRLTRQLMRPGYTDARSARVLLPWSLDYATPRWFNAGRIISAAHVYTHLAVLYTIALQHGQPQSTGCSQETMERRLATALERGDYLLRSLSFKHVRHEIGQDGILLHQQLTHMLTVARESIPANLVSTLHSWRDLQERDVVERVEHTEEVHA